MTNKQDRVDQLLEKLETLLERQQSFSNEVNKLRDEINLLKTAEANLASMKTEDKVDWSVLSPEVENEPEEIELSYQSPKQTETKEQPEAVIPKTRKTPKVKSDLERFIGENLINKIGIAITVIGVAIGAKYAIDHQLISPLTRMILGYLVGLGLLGFAIQLKKNYVDLSAVLLSGSMAIMYFITYAAYGFYALIPQTLAFVLMVIFTVFTVLAALSYDRQVIAHIGLVGAYAVPFLLSDDSGQVVVLFSYIAIINVGILVLAFRKNWKSLYYVSFLLTWIMYFSWYLTDYEVGEFFVPALTFLTIFFTTFYLTFLAYNLIHKEEFKVRDILLLLANSFIYYGLGYFILGSHETGGQLLGLFTLGNAIIHFGVAVVIYRKKLADKNLFYLVSGLVLVFITIAIPVQLDGNWVTLIWAGEAALLFWIGRTKNVPVYEKLSYPLMLLAFFSIFQDWDIVYGNFDPEIPETRLTPIFNINFLTSILVIGFFGFINLIDRNSKYLSPLKQKTSPFRLFSYVIPALFLITLYSAFNMEIGNYWNQLYKDSVINIDVGNNSYLNFQRNSDLLQFSNIWLLNYSMLFFGILSFVNIRKFKNSQLGNINLFLNTFILLVFLTQGLYLISELRESYLGQGPGNYFQHGFMNIGIRYVSFAFVATLLFASYKYTLQAFMKAKLKTAFDFVLHISIVWIASSELLHWMDIAESSQSYKLGLSILWGIYSLLLISLGIWKRKKHLRISGIVLFAITLIKLISYDITHLNTISQTIVFVSLGILLLIISFLYNKYKYIISDKNES
ncbi:MAG: DUF2339 domain-containing protein [Chlorobi bacterium]|nr:DUF2339 domain-containing protein [Chlorobiota bacterium]